MYKYLYVTNFHAKFLQSITQPYTMRSVNYWIHCILCKYSLQLYFGMAKNLLYIGLILVLDEVLQMVWQLHAVFCNIQLGW